MTATTTPETTTKTVAEEAIVGTAKITVVENKMLSATTRCIACGAQAYVECEVFDTETRIKRVIEFCAHHYNKNEIALVQQSARIIDYRPYLLIQERAFKGQI